MEGAEILSVFQYTVECLLTVADPGKGTGAPGLPLFYDQTEARRAKKLFLETAPLPPSYLRVWMTGPPPPLISRSGSGNDSRDQKKAIML